MTTTAQLPTDPLASLANTDTQRLAARMAQDVFAGIFRQTVSVDAAPNLGLLGELAAHCYSWCQGSADESGRVLRLALLISGLDQWGLAYTQAFKLEAIPSLTALIGGLRTRLDARDDNRFQRFFDQIDAVESAALEFKVELRRNIHLALWHAMAASDSPGEVESIVQSLGSMMLVLNERMPKLGWRLMADALASIQIALLSSPAPASALAEEGTQQLFASLRHVLPTERYQAILAYSGQAVVAWQQARQAAAN